MVGTFIEFMTWDRLEAQMQSPQTFVIPIGARLKEHGLHLQLNNDYLLAKYLAKRVAEELKVLILPTVPYGYYPAFLAYPGSVSLDEDVFARTIENIVLSFARHGQHRFYCLNTGVSTNRPLNTCRDSLAKKGIPFAFTNLLSLLTPWEELVCSQPRGTHADEAETSMMLEIAPGTVQMGRAVVEIGERISPGPFSRDPDTDQGLYSSTGAWGDPTLATRSKGRRILKGFVTDLCQEIEQFRLARD